MQIALGMSPISWSNDDLPELGGSTSLATCLRETRAAGFTGTETGGKFPKSPQALAQLLHEHDLALVSGWYSGRLIKNELDAELDQIAEQLALFKACGASVLVYGETFATIQNQRRCALSSRVQLRDFDVAAYGRKLTKLAEHCAENGVPLSFHHHMGTAVETEQEVDQLMNATGDSVGLLVDTGHLLFAGGDPVEVIKRHGARINHVHAKDVRAQILRRVDPEVDSFLDCVLQGVFTVPGDGVIDYQLVMQNLADCGYQGWVVVEAEQDPARANPFQYAKIGHQALRSAALGAGYTIADRVRFTKAVNQDSG